MINLNSKITELYRVGAATAKILAKLDLATAQDLLDYFPFRYDDFSKNVSIADLKPDTAANLTATIDLIQNKKSAKRRMYITEALVSDETDSLKVIWFNQPFLTHTLRVGDKISLAGRVSETYGQLAMISPVYEKTYGDELIHTQGLVPNYHLTADLTQKQLRFLIKKVLPLADQVRDWLPPEVKTQLGLMDLSSALKKIHFPADLKEAEAARQRLNFGELFLLQLKAQIIKRELKSRRALPVKFQKEATQKFVASLPFKLTEAQRRSAWEILQDMEKSEPMSRLLQGEVGSGKTLVAVMALLNTALSGKQSVLMAPTAILAGQHFNSLNRFLAPYNFKIALLTGDAKTPDWERADIIVGTHALIQDNVRFDNLALAIVDEQHRFGVKQRQQILDFNGSADKTPHFMSMTATPIPRSLALTIYGDLDISVIDQMPAGRKPVITKIVTEAKRTAAYDFIRDEIKAGRQAFVICPLIDESDKLGVKSVKKEHAKLDQEIFPELKVGLLHGRLKPKAKEKVMADFAANKIQLLVSTSVVEVGVDVANATIMIIEGADRFGLAEMHQFRGRVGRNNLQSYCFLFPSSEEISNPKTLDRLAALTKHHDGYSLAQMDLKLRGGGEFYGTAQSGQNPIALATLFDYEMIKKARDAAAAIINDDPTLARYPLIKTKLGEWDKVAHLE